MKSPLFDLPTLPAAIDPADDAAWAPLRSCWDMPDGVTFLNHGSFGLPARCVVAAQQHWHREMSGNPMAMFVDRFEPLLISVRDRVADFVGARHDNLVLVENATYGMNVVARCFPLAPGDEVLLNDHEYGAVKRIWQRACDRSGARLVETPIALPIESEEQLADAVMAGATERTRLIVASHVTSPSALRLPVAEICRRAAACGIRTCIDGPHAVAMLPLELESLGCDYYTASCHKWLAGPIGTGFLYVRPELQSQIEPLVVSWGRVGPGVPETWQEWFTWLGTRDVSAMLALPTAIDFLTTIGLERFRARAHHLARYARARLLELKGAAPIAPDGPQWYGPMVAVYHPYADALMLRDRIRKQHRVEAVLSPWHGASLIRVSCHLYTQPAEIDRMIDVFELELGGHAQ